MTAHPEATPGLQGATMTITGGTRSFGSTMAMDLPYAREVLDGYPNAYYFNPSLSNQLASLMRKENVDE